MAKSVDLTYYQADTKPLDITVLDEDDAIVDISSATEIRWTLAASAGSASLISPVKSQTGGEITLPGTGTDGVFRVAMVAGDTSGLTPGNFYHEADIVLSSVEETTLVGTFTLRPSTLQ